MTIQTLVAGTLTVASALPDPPFEMFVDRQPAGFDVAWMQAIGSDLGLAVRLRRYEGPDFNNIFAELDKGGCDCIASGTTVTPQRQLQADFCTPYLVSGQSLVCNVVRTPAIHDIDDLRGQVIAVQSGNTSQPVAEALKARGAVAEVRIYPYDGIGTMLDDLEAGRIAAVMKLAPVMRWLIRERPDLGIVQENITTEKLAVSVRRGNAALLAAINGAQARLTASGELQRLLDRWIGS